MAPITDEGPGQYTDEPKGVVTSPESTVPGGIAPDRGMGTQETLDSRTGETMWSQPSAEQSQSGASTPTSHAHAQAGVGHFSQLPPIVTSRGKPMELERPGPGESDRLPELPSGAGAAGPQSTRLAEPIDAGSEAHSRQERSITPQAQPMPQSQAQPPTSQVLAASALPQRPLDEQIHTPTPRKVSSGELVSSPEKGLHQEPAAIYLQNMVDEPQSQHLAPAPRDTRVRSPSDTGSLSSIGRKPSGARAPPPKKSSTGPLRSLSAVDEHGQPIDSPLSPPISAVGVPATAVAEPEQVTSPRKNDQALPRSTTHDDLGEDVSAYVAYADQPSPELDKGKGKEKEQELAPPVKEVDAPRSSFALSKAAAERRARAEEAAAEKERAKRIPGGGKRTGPIKKDQWMESDSDEDEDEEEEEDSPEVPKRSTMVQQPRAREGEYQNQGLERSGSRARALPSIPRPTNGPDREYTPDQERYLSQSQIREQDRQRPNSRSPNPNPAPRPNTQYRDSYADRGRMSMAPPRSQYEVQRPAQGRTPPPGPGNSQQNRQSVWNANFAADHGMHENKSGKFVEMEDPAAQLTKPFAPHGLLQAGLQDREDRSAKRQEELARETGTSLINVPSKPPPPQTGLLGAVAAHERERKNAGGIGATLTDRERERRQNVSINSVRKFKGWLTW